MAVNDGDPRDPVLTGDEVRNVKFGKGHYDASQVSDLLARIAAELDAGRPAGPLIANATLHKRQRGAGCHMGQVDWFLDQLRRREDPAEADRMNADPWRDLPADNYCIGREPGDPAGRVTAPSQQECADAWRDFPRQPGTRLSWVKTRFLRYELRTAEQQTVVSDTLAVGGRTSTWKRVTKSSWPGIAGTISNDLPGALGHILVREAGEKDAELRQLRDETGIPVLYTARRYDEAGVRYIKFPGQRWLRFPVRGYTWKGAIMTAVDQDGNKVARYRLARFWGSAEKTTEITVHPDQRLTDELAVVIAASFSWLDSYVYPGGGGLCAWSTLTPGAEGCTASRTCTRTRRKPAKGSDQSSHWRAAPPADLANGFANNRPGRARTRLESLSDYMPGQQVKSTLADSLGCADSNGDNAPRHACCIATWAYVRPEKQMVEGQRLGATVGATRMNNLLALRTCLDNGERRARGHELI